MQPLPRKLALATAALALTAPALSSCGFDYATDRVYTPAAGTNDRDGVVDVLGAVVVSTEPGSGTFVASLSNNSTEESATLDSVSGEGVESAGFAPIEVPAGGLVNLADPAAEIEVTGEFESGDFVDLTLSFDNGEEATLEVPVVPNAGDYAGLDGPAPAETEPAAPETDDGH